MKCFLFIVSETEKFNISSLTSGKGCHAASFHDGRKTRKCVRQWAMHPFTVIPAVDDINSSL